jgi:hypothetical protein
MFLFRLLLEELQRRAMTFITARFTAKVVQRAVAGGGDDPACG